MNLIVGIFAYNEEQTLPRCIESVCGQTIYDSINKIVIYADGCTDNTIQVAQRLEKNNSRISVIEHPERQGKVSRVREFIMNHTGYDAMVVASADIILDSACLEKMILNFNDPECGIVGVKVIPSGKSSTEAPMQRVARVMWDLHHRISRHQPKFGELIVFRNIPMDIGDGCVDEEQVAQAVRSRGFKGKYESEAVVYNFPPISYQALFYQRRRIWCGHLELKNRTGYKVPTTSPTEIVRAMRSAASEHGLKDLLTAVALEIPSILYGYVDYLTCPAKHYKWKRGK